MAGVKYLKRLEELSEGLSKLSILINREKYRESIEINKIVADSKVHQEGVEFYEHKVALGEEVGTLLVVKHPTEDLYAVLDGHHKYWGTRGFLEQMPSEERFIRQMDCAVIPDYFGLLFNPTNEGLLFYLTKEGLLQPPKQVTKYIRTPLKKVR